MNVAVMLCSISRREPDGILMALTISIIMPSFNQRRFLAEAVDSVLSQEGPLETELIVVDGASTDGSAELLKSIADPRLKWSSEPDGGQADALCKGLGRARGQIIGWLNSDDRYHAGALARVAGAFDANSCATWLVGRCAIIDEGGQTIRAWISRHKDHHLRRYSFEGLVRRNFISQPAVFWRRDFGAKVGPPDAALHHAMDYDLWLRMAKLAPPVIVDEVLADFRIHAASKTGSAYRRGFREHVRVAERHAADHRWSLLANRVITFGIVTTYRVLSLLGR